MNDTLTKIVAEQKPYLKSSSVSQYVKCIERLHKRIFGDDGEFTNVDFIKDSEAVENALADLSFTTRRNYYSAIITLLQAEETPDKVLIKQYSKIVKLSNDKYVEENKTGVISDKQKDKLVSIDQINLLLEYLKKEGGMEYILFKLLSIYHLRNEIATLRLITPADFKKLKKEEKENNNYLVVGTKRMYIARNDYKTQKKYGEIIINIDDKEFQKEFRTYLDTLNNDIVFPYNNEPMTKKRLTNHLMYHSHRHIGVRLSTTMLAKSILSHKYSAQKDEQQKDAAARGHSVNIQNSIYIKTLPEDIGNKEFTSSEED